MARDRKRAKQRQRRAKAGALPPPVQPRHENVPGELEHGSGDIQEFDAALIAGAGGEVADPDSASAPGDGDPDITDAQAPASTSRRAGADGENRVLSFLRASWAELQRVQWPDRRQVFQATAVVLGFVAIAGAYLGLADYVASTVVDAIL